MARKTTPLLLALFLAAATALGAEAQRTTWIGSARKYTGMAFKSMGREISSWMDSMHKSVAAVKRDTAKGLASITESGRQGLASVQRSTAHTVNLAVKGTHDTLTSVTREIVPVGTAPVPKGAVYVAREIQSPAIDPLFLRRQDIVLAWKTGTGGRPIRRSVVLEDRIVLEDQAGEIYSFAPGNGIVQWVYPLPAPSQTEYRTDATTLFVVAQDALYEIDRLIGLPRRRMIFPFPVSSQPTIDGDLVIVGSWDRRIYAINRNTRVKEWTFVPTGMPEAGVAIAPNMAYVADTDGRLTAYSPPERRIQWTFEADDAIRVSLLMYENDLYFPAEDLAVYCVNRFGGFRAWKFPVQGRVLQQPWIDGDRIYFAAENDGFYAVNIEKGDLIWRCPGGGWPVAIGTLNLYIRGPNNEIWCVDRKTGKKVWSVSAEPFHHFVRNTDTDHMYLCTDQGQVVALYLRGDHVEKKVAPEKKPGPPKEPRIKGPAVEEPTPGAVTPRPRPAAKAKLPTKTKKPAVDKGKVKEEGIEEGKAKEEGVEEGKAKEEAKPKEEAVEEGKAKPKEEGVEEPKESPKPKPKAKSKLEDEEEK